MKSTNNVPPINIRNKDIWIGKERQRWASLFSIPMDPRPLPKFPIMTLYVQRVLAALTTIDNDNETLAKAVDKLWEAFWVDQKDISEKDIYEKIIAGAIGEDKLKKSVELAGSVGKSLILKNTELAVNDGAFGLPWMACTNSKGETEGFWGVDHLGQVVDFLGLKAPKSNAGWKSLL